MISYTADFVYNYLSVTKYGENKTKYIKYTFNFDLFIALKSKSN